MFQVQSKLFSRIVLTTQFTLRKCSKNTSAFVVGCWKNGEELSLTETGSSLNNEVSGRLNELLQISNFKGKLGETKTFYGLDSRYGHVVVTGLGEKEIDYDENETIDESKENVRIGIGAAVKMLRKENMGKVFIDSCHQSAAASEGAALSARKFDRFKSKKTSKMDIELFQINGSDSDVSDSWGEGRIYADGQNFAATLMDMPSNHLYPDLFAEAVEERFSDLPSIELRVRNKEWIESQKMGCYLSVANGSIHKPVFLEVHYEGGKKGEPPIVLVGKGITFDSGGISIKPSKGMSEMKADMGGAACVLGTIDAVARLQLPVNMIVLTPLAENMPSGNSAKPGDVATAMNGKTVENDNTDAEGRLILADALCYGEKFQPSHIIDVATLTGAIAVALGHAATGFYSTSNELWEHFDKASYVSGDRIWRMPLYKSYTEEMKCSSTADLRNTQKSAGYAGSPTAAAFLKEFVTTKNWAHLDIAGVMSNQGANIPYLPQGMSGRPTRTLIEAIRNMTATR